VKKLKRTIFFLNIVFATLLIAIYFVIGISPEKSVIYTIVPLLFFLLLGINMLFMVFWIIFKWKLAFISLAAFLITFKFINLIVPFTAYINLNKGEAGDLKLMTYNVMVFGLYKWQDNVNIKSNILQVIDEEQPDVICLQEAYWKNNSKNFKTVDSIMLILDTKYVHRKSMTQTIDGQNFGFATISKYPIVNTYSYKFENSFNGFIFTDILIDNDTVRVYNCHLQSIHFDESDYTLVESLKEAEFNNEMKSLLKKYLKSYQKRASQADVVRASIDSCQYPVFVCGDFNDLPVSYTYNKISSGLKDAFTSHGNIPGGTLNAFKIKQRIDFILYDAGFKCTDYKLIEKKYSDHYPVVGEFKLKK
jgi:endonuclease/exonuclease/phosphatase family metal-dependent hydrolase